MKKAGIRDARDAVNFLEFAHKRLAGAVESAETDGERKEAKARLGRVEHELFDVQTWAESLEAGK